jgi:hypothetical protein
MPKVTKDIFKIVSKEFLELIKFKFVFWFIIGSLLTTLITSLITIFSHQSYEILLNLSFEVVIFSFCFLIFGIYITRKVNLKYIRKIADVDPQKYYNLLISKFIILLLYVIVFIFLNLGIIMFFLSRDNLAKEVLLESIFYTFIYWFIPYMSCGLVGITLGVMNHRIGGIIFVGFVFCFLLSPFNFVILNLLTDFLKLINFDIFVKYIDKSIETLCIMPQIKIPFNSINPYVIDKVKWLDNLIIFISTILFFHFILMFEFDDDDRRNYIGFGILTGAIAFFIIYLNYPKDLFEMLNKEEYKDKVYYSSAKTSDLENEGGIFTVNNYDILLEQEDILNIELNMELEVLDNDVQNLFFVFYHGFYINNLTVNNGKNFTYEVEDDLLKIVLDRSADNGDNIDIKMDYSGIGSDTFINYRNELVLPSYFPWLPRAFLNEYNGFIETENGDIPASIDYKSNYKLQYIGENKIYTNITEESNNTWSGETQKGLSVLQGKLDSNESDSYRNIYPSYEVGMNEYTERFSDELVEEIEKQKKFFNVKNDSNVKDVFYLPLEFISDSNIMMDMGDHLIIALKKSYNPRYYKDTSFDELNNEIYMSIEAILSNYSKSDLEYKEKKQVFVQMYEYYNKLIKVTKSKFVDDSYTEKINDEEIDLKKKKETYETENNLNDYNIKLDAIVLKKEIKEFIDDELDNNENDKINKFFKSYYKILISEEPDFAKINEILK